MTDLMRHSNIQYKVGHPWDGQILHCDDTVTKYRMEPDEVTEISGYLEND
jgi:hypothetical protein